ncbi:MAG TPA: hypothetical protein VHQ94_00655 [Pyrinomonadaceae bacterium]|nr:hypothetical protein [Pyrinomonadaceae bacterium]
MRTATKWFVIGFGVRLALGLLVMLGSLTDPDVSMWLIFDPSLFWTTLLHDWLSARGPDLNPSHPLYRVFHMFFGGHPVYPLYNLIGSMLWGLIVMTAARLFTALRSKRTSGKTVPQADAFAGRK